MKRPIMAFLRAALSALPSFLRRSSAAIAVATVLLVGIGMVTGIIPNVIAALQAQALAFRISSEKEVEEQTTAKAIRATEQDVTERLIALANRERGVSAASILNSSRRVYPNPDFVAVLESIINSECGEICTRDEIFKVMKDERVINETKTYYPSDKIARLTALNNAFQLIDYDIDLVKIAKDRDQGKL